MDVSFHNSLVYVLENDPESLELTFSVLEESFGEVSVEHVVNEEVAAFKSNWKRVGFS